MGEKQNKIPSKRKTVLADIGKSILLLLAATAMGYVFQISGFSESNIIMIYILGVLLTSVFTTRRIYSLASSIISVLAFNFLFTEPQFTFHAYEKDYPITFLVMLLVAFISSSLAIQLKNKAEVIQRTLQEKEDAVVMAKQEQMRANLLRSISHDLRTPLTSISGNASNLLSNDGKFDEETRKQLYADIYEDSVWLMKVVENVLAVTRIEEGQLNLRITTELMDEVIDEALRHLGRNEKKHHVVVKTPNEFILAKMDVQLIVQALVNLIDNAVKYTPEDTEIIVETKKEGDKVIVSVSDNGPGMSEEVKKHAFEMFYTGSGNRADSRRSLGLGLFLCKSIVTAHGGTIEVRDNSPQGTVFQFTLQAGEVKLYE